MFACLTINGAEQGEIGRTALMALTYPLCKIAEKLGVTKVDVEQPKSVYEAQQLPPGIWICDGTGDGAAYNYIDLIDKMTERMSHV